MKVITITGSMKFARQMKDIARKLEDQKGYCVLQPIYHNKKLKLTIEELENVHAGLMKKIDLCDALYVVNIGGYIGEFTKNAIKYAKKNKREVIYHEPLK